MNQKDDPFDPVAFYSDDPLPPSSSTTADPLMIPTTAAAASTLRRSVRPKPAAEALISSPPAIKFYESTVVRKSKNKLKTPVATLTEESSTTDSFTSKNQILKLRLSSTSTSAQSSKENISEKRNLRVVKLMMPDVLEDNDFNSKRASPVKIVKLPLLAPKLSTTVVFPNNPPPLEIKEQRKKRKVKEELNTTAVVVVPVKAKTEIVNEDVCSACGGLGNFICCDSCPRSFHFTCAEPPLDSQNLPEDDWYCCECRHQQQQHQQTTENKSIWDFMINDAVKSNPKCFVMPRRFRYQPKDEDLHKLLTGQLVMKNETSRATNINNKIPMSSLESSRDPHHLMIQTTHPHSHPPHHTEIVINETIKLDHCTIRAPNISLHKASTGYCHCCGLFGLTKTALAKVDEDSTIPADIRYHRPILSCAICPLYWHLDCLDPPLASFPSDNSWTCPIHFTTEKCLALDLAESLVQATLLLPESAVKLQFSRKLERLRQSENNQVRVDNVDDELEVAFGLSNSINVPEFIKRVY